MLSEATKLGSAPMIGSKKTIITEKKTKTKKTTTIEEHGFQVTGAHVIAAGIVVLVLKSKVLEEPRTLKEKIAKDPWKALSPITWF